MGSLAAAIPDPVPDSGEPPAKRRAVAAIVSAPAQRASSLQVSRRERKRRDEENAGKEAHIAAHHPLLQAGPRISSVSQQDIASSHHGTAPTPHLLCFLPTLWGLLICFFFFSFFFPFFCCCCGWLDQAIMPRLQAHMCRCRWRRRRLPQCRPCSSSSRRP